MNRFGNWIQAILKVIGADAESFRKMNKALKFSGLALIVLFLIAVVISAIFEPEKSPKQKLAEASMQEQPLAKQMEKDLSPSMEFTKTISSVLGWVSVACFALAALIEPKEPKRDGRFKTGFKNNATVRKKSPSEIRLQRGAITIAAITGILWYFVR